MQADPDKAVVFSDLTLMQRKNCFLILGPHTAVEATGVLHVVGFYRKLMVRNSKHAAANCYALPENHIFAVETIVIFSFQQSKLQYRCISACFSLSSLFISFAWCNQPGSHITESPYAELRLY